MRGSVAWLFLGRLAFNAFFLLSAVYCLMAFNPFTYERLVRDQILGWVTVFLQRQPTVYWVASFIGALTVLGHLRRPRTKWLAVAHLVLSVVGGVFLAIHPVLLTLRNDAFSLYWGALFLVPMVSVAAMDHLATRGEVAWAGDGETTYGNLFRAFVHAGLFVVFVFACFFHLRFGLRNAVFPLAAEVIAVSASLVLHLLAFATGFILMSFNRALSGVFAKPARAEFYLGALALAAFIAWIIRDMIFPTITLRGTVGTCAALVLAALLVFILCGLAVLAQPARQAVDSGIVLLLAPLGLPRASSRLRSFAQLAGLALAGCLMVKGASAEDWNGLMQKNAALVFWTLVLSTQLKKTALQPEPAEQRGSLEWVMLALLIVAGYRTYQTRRGYLPDLLGNRKLDIEVLLNRFGEYEPSFRVLYETFRPPQTDDNAFYAFLQKNTNIPRERPVKPVDVNFVSPLTESANEKPNIFIVTVDSLRRDYLSPYNKAVTFTPHIQRFAEEADVFRQTFTHYGATGMSEPSIWVGGVMPHKQYIIPFQPLNGLEKLVKAERYDRHISVDNVLRLLIDKDEGLNPLDKNIQVKDYDLCRSLEELAGRLEARTDSSRPVFAYTQPQNIHIARIAREGKTVPPGVTYPPQFYAPYAYRLQHVDSCFGTFIEFLRTSGLYDKSIVVLTADHGDSLGDDGRWGHAYMVNPEISRIPLLMRVPPALREKLETNHELVTFSTDITPSLYDLLGHRPTLTHENFGRPLFWRRGEAPRQNREWELIVSSYGPVYGVVGDNGRKLFVIDAVSYTDAYYDMSDPLNSQRLSISRNLRNQMEKRIRVAINRISEFYKVEGLD